MILQIGTIAGYNNKIVIATENQTLGFNDEVNVKPVLPTTQPTNIQGTSTKKSLPEPIDHQTVHSTPTVQPIKEAMQHEDNKTALQQNKTKQQNRSGVRLYDDPDLKLFILVS